MSNFDVWKKSFDGNVALVVKADEKTFKEASHEFYKRVVDRTPVGNPSIWKWPAHSNYKPGTLKASWTIESSGTYAVIENIQPYAYRVETGWSTQAPEGMMRITIAEFSSIVAQFAEKNKI